MTSSCALDLIDASSKKTHAITNGRGGGVMCDPRLVFALSLYKRADKEFRMSSTYSRDLKAKTSGYLLVSKVPHIFPSEQSFICV